MYLGLVETIEVAIDPYFLDGGSFGFSWLVEDLWWTVAVDYFCYKNYYYRENFFQTTMVFCHYLKFSVNLFGSITYR